MAKEKIKIRLKSYDHRLLDQSAKKIVDNLWDRGATSLHSSLTGVRNIDHIVYAGIFNDDNLLYGLLVLEYQNGENTFHPDIVNEVEIAKWTSEISQLYKYIKKY